MAVPKMAIMMITVEADTYRGSVVKNVFSWGWGRGGGTKLLVFHVSSGHYVMNELFILRKTIILRIVDTATL